MDDIGIEEIIHVRPKPGSMVNVSQRVPLPAFWTCRNLQRMFRIRISKALTTTDVAELTCAILLVAIAADILFSLCTRKRMHMQRGFVSSSTRSHNLGFVIASFMVQIT
ncbi:hypothetical protein TSMEX_008943 [Taenia solium]|eukprot:TsM_001183500 transcript=TsM_001183500 gene=TsM_001183500